MSKRLSIVWTIPFLGFALGYLGTYLFVQTNSVITPSVIGKNLQESAEILSKQRLGIRLLKEQEDSSLPEGVLMDQFPRPGQKIRPNQDIFVTVSKKPKIFQAPDFLCLKHKDILSLAAKYGIDVNFVFLHSSHSLNTCYAQNPKNGTELNKRKITACISKGLFPLVIVPNFKGHILHEVENFINKFDVQLDLITTTSSSGDCVVVEQSPIAGSIVALDRPVQIQLQVGG
jgi:serine/threonine-protein kinase